MLGFAGMDERLRHHAEATVSYAEKFGIVPVIISVRRNYAEQAKLYSNYRAGKSKWPANPPGQSAHQYGVAFDATVKPEHQEAWNYIRRGFGWRVHETDPPHAEYPDWQSVRDYLRYS
jgi:predicted amidohydrolase YtcJ